MKKDFNPEEYITGGDYVDSMKRRYPATREEAHNLGPEGGQSYLEDFPKHWQNKYTLGADPCSCSEGNLTDTTNLNDMENKETEHKLKDEKPVELYGRPVKYKMNPEDWVEHELKTHKSVRDFMEKYAKANSSDSEGQSPPEIQVIIQELNSQAEALNQLAESVLMKCQILMPTEGESFATSDDIKDEPDGLINGIKRKIELFSYIRKKFDLANQILTKIVG